MCFKKLPIEFDGAGKARLKEGVKDPYSFDTVALKSYARPADGPGAKLGAPHRLRDGRPRGLRRRLRRRPRRRPWLQARAT